MTKFRLAYLIFFTAIIVDSCTSIINNSDKHKLSDSSKILNIKENKNNIDSGSNHTSYANTVSIKNQQKIYDIIFALQEVKERMKYIETKTKGKRLLKIWIYQTPEETVNKCYWIKAGEDNGVTFVSHFNFFVNPKNFEIKYYDIVNDTIISLDTWRQEFKNN